MSSFPRKAKYVKCSFLNSYSYKNFITTLALEKKLLEFLDNLAGSLSERHVQLICYPERAYLIRKNELFIFFSVQSMHLQKDFLSKPNFLVKEQNNTSKRFKNLLVLNLNSFVKAAFTVVSTLFTYQFICYVIHLRQLVGFRFAKRHFFKIVKNLVTRTKFIEEIQSTKIPVAKA